MQCFPHFLEIRMRGMEIEKKRNPGREKLGRGKEKWIGLNKREGFGGEEIEER